MSAHRVLLVEDDRDLSAQLREILEADGYVCMTTNNREAASALLESDNFCLIVLDLQILAARDSLQGHDVQGRRLLQDIRQKYPMHNGAPWWMPVIVISAYARAADEAVNVMRDGASDVIQKPFGTDRFREAIRRELRSSGREKHTSCGPVPPVGRNEANEHVLVLDGGRRKRRTRVVVNGVECWLTDARLRVLLHLVVGKLEGNHVHKLKMGARADEGFRGVSDLAEQLRPGAGSAKLVDNDHNGHYWLVEAVRVEVPAPHLFQQVGDASIMDLSRRIAELQTVR